MMFNDFRDLVLYYSVYPDRFKTKLPKKRDIGLKYKKVMDEVNRKLGIDPDVFIEVYDIKTLKKVLRKEKFFATTVPAGGVPISPTLSDADVSFKGNNKRCTISLRISPRFGIRLFRWLIAHEARHVWQRDNRIALLELFGSEARNSLLKLIAKREGIKPSKIDILSEKLDDSLYLFVYHKYHGLFPEEVDANLFASVFSGMSKLTFDMLIEDTIGKI